MSLVRYSSRYSPQWQSYPVLSHRTRPPATLKPWLLHEGSLTQKLRTLAKGDLSVRIIHQTLNIPTLSERVLLNLKRREMALIREVVLCGQGEDWVFARSVLPISHLTQRLRRLRKQGTTPLGSFLFSHRDLERSSIQVAALTTAHHYLPRELLKQPLYFGRRSLFSLDQRAILVSEVFLDKFLPHIANP